MKDYDIDRLLDLMRSRRSVRKFASLPLPAGSEDKLLEAFVWSPSGGNAQPWQIRIVRDTGRKERLCKAALSQGFVAEAPVLYVICADLDRAFKAYKQRGVELYCLQDTAAATQNLLLAAHALGLGACWVGAFRERSAKEILELPDHLRPVAIVAVGVPAEDPRIPPRRPVLDVVTEC